MEGMMTTPESSSLAARASAWRDVDPDPQTRAELDQLLASGDTAALAERFDGSLAFGTAGIRAEIGAGPMRMNRLVVGRVAAGLARYITASDPAAATDGVVVGYDGRTNSAVFAMDAARILSRAGVRVSVLPGPLPTPVLAFSVRNRDAAYGLMVTASHNPRQYNGIKVYVRDGGQLLPPVDAQIAAAIDAVDPLRLPAGWADGPFDFAPADDSVTAYVTEQAGADLVLANDPDADRLAVMVPGPGGWRAFTGDELGALLGDAVLTRLAAGDPVADPGERTPVVATTVVSGSLLRRLADAAGVRCVTTLTGFKWIARAGGDDHALIYGYEQALGYAVRPDLVADKDGISAALLVLQLATEEASQGRTLSDRLDDLALTHGLHVTGLQTLKADGAAGLAQLNDAVERVRKEPPRLLAGQPVTVTDLSEAAPGIVDLAGGHAERSPGQPLPPADVLIWHAGRDARVMIRPSGTEPELKIYAEVVRPVRSRAELAAARAGAAELAEQLMAAAALTLGAGGDQS